MDVVNASGVRGLATEASDILTHKGYHEGDLSLGNAGETTATAVEYGLMASLIALAIITAVTALGTRLAAIFAQITGSI